MPYRLPLKHHPTLSHMWMRSRSTIGPKEAQRIRSEIRGWQLSSRWTNKTLNALARFVNEHVRGWITHYGHIYVPALHPILRNLNEHLARWARRKYKDTPDRYSAIPSQAPLPGGDE